MSPLETRAVAALQQVSTILGGQRPSKGTYERVRLEQKLPLPGARALVRHKPWRDWLEQAGFDVSELPIQAELVRTEDELLNELRGLYAQLQTPLTLKDVETHTTINALILSRRFGGLRKACLKIAVPVKNTAVHKRSSKKGRRLTDSELLQLLRDQYAEHKTPFDWNLVEKLTTFTPYVYTNRFGSIRAACQKAGVPIATHGSKASALLDRVQQLLDLEIEREVSFDWLRNPLTNYPLRFDGFIPEYQIAIELDGQSHRDHGYYIRMFNRTSKDFEHMQARDQFKNRAAHANGVALLRFSYPCTAADVAASINETLRNYS